MWRARRRRHCRSNCFGIGSGAHTRSTVHTHFAGVRTRCCPRFWRVLPRSSIEARTPGERAAQKAFVSNQIRRTARGHFLQRLQRNNINMYLDGTSCLHGCKIAPVMEREPTSQASQAFTSILPFGQAEE
eukprot:364183-Chlamydomonas_euryale.AAC.6